MSRPAQPDLLLVGSEGQNASVGAGFGNPSHALDHAISAGRDGYTAVPSGRPARSPSRDKQIGAHH
jgi:hypothetical protein